MPDVVTYSGLISAWEKGKQPERALDVFEAMVQQGVVPDVVTYGGLISACEKGKQPERVLDIVKQWCSKVLRPLQPLTML